MCRKTCAQPPSPCKLPAEGYTLAGRRQMLRFMVNSLEARAVVNQQQDYRLKRAVRSSALTAFNCRAIEVHWKSLAPSRPARRSRCALETREEALSSFCFACFFR